jgi:RNA polymerase sigma-70 factor (ECF subfamily)
MSQPLAAAAPIAGSRSSDRRQWLASLFDAHEERLYRLARRLTASADDARDLVQDTFLKAARSSSSVPAGFDGEEAWLVRVLVNIRRDQWRKAAVRRRFAASCAGARSGNPSPESALDAKRAVWNALDALPPRRRAIVVMTEFDGLSLSRIASVLGISGATVRWHLAMGRRDLKRLLASFLGDLP